LYLLLALTYQYIALGCLASSCYVSILDQTSENPSYSKVEVVAVTAFFFLMATYTITWANSMRKLVKNDRNQLAAAVKHEESVKNWFNFEQ
jgi:hypothetical protein